MQNVIHLLPDAIANQIAAGEVVQRPASVVKELLENAIDAQANRIDLFIKDAGRTLVQVTDDGMGMSSADVRMSFERHATSKIREQEDLFRINTLGFRGEALSSIAAVAQVRVRTRLHSEELGTEMEINGSEIVKQESCVCPPGTTFFVRNLFYNVPARRNFLKSNPVETRHILNEFIRIALAHPEVAMTFTHDNTEVYKLPSGTLEERIVHLIDKKLEGKTIPVFESAGYVKISGFIGDASYYKNRRGDQFFFVNGRYIKSNYLHHAVANVYGDFIPEDNYPFYCIFLEVDPVHVDINIHPTKTEVKFDDEKTLYILLQTTIKQALGEAHQIPGERIAKSSGEIQEEIYNSKVPPDVQNTVGDFRPPVSSEPRPKVSRQEWEAFYAQAKENIPEAKVQNQQLFPSDLAKSRELDTGFYVQLLQTYILTSYEEKLYIIHQELAHQRIIYERLMAVRESRKLASQQLLFPQTLELSPADFLLIKEAEEVLQRLGFEVREFADNTIIVYGMPAEISSQKAKDIFEQFIADMNETGMSQIEDKLQHAIARAVAIKSSISRGQKLNEREMYKLVSELFQCKMAAKSLSDSPTWRVIPAIELEKYFG